MNVFISPRVEKSIIRYYSSAIRWMDEDVAVDYAILQKILPFISGTGENYEKVIKDICVITEDYDLLLTSEKIKEICYKATKNMNIYQFFS